MARAARQLKLSGVFASCITPRRAGSQDPDFSGLLDLLDFLAEGGVTGISLFDQTGEFLDYTFEERQRLLYLGAKRSRVPLISGVSHSTFDGALRLAGEAISSGADGLMVMAPYFYEYPQRDLETFFMEFARETGDAVPIIIQNLPQSTSTLEFDLMRRLMETGRFAGINEASGDWSLFETLIDLKKQMRFALLCGSDRLVVRALQSGADAVISSAACAIPEVVSSLSRGRENMDQGLAEFLDWSEKFPFPVAIKRAVELRGQKSSPALMPLAPEGDAALNEFSAWFKGWLPQMRKAAAHV